MPFFWKGERDDILLQWTTTASRNILLPWCLLQDAQAQTSSSCGWGLDDLQSSSSCATCHGKYLKKLKEKLRSNKKSNTNTTISQGGYYRPQRSCGKVMFLHPSVILSTKGGVWHTPPKRQPLQWTVRILLECILVIPKTIMNHEPWF